MVVPPPATCDHEPVLPAKLGVAASEIALPQIESFRPALAMGHGKTLTEKQAGWLSPHLSEIVAQTEPLEFCGKFKVKTCVFCPPMSVAPAGKVHSKVVALATFDKLKLAVEPAQTVAAPEIVGDAGGCPSVIFLQTCWLVPHKFSIERQTEAAAPPDEMTKRICVVPCPAMICPPVADQV